MSVAVLPIPERALVAERPSSEVSAVATRDVAIDYLRTGATIAVVLHHSLLSYCTWAVHASKDIFHSVAPIVDPARWIVFDYITGLNDTFLMVLMFFISGLFVSSGIRKRGPAVFLHERLFRLGLPFLFCILVINPAGYFPAWLATGHTGGFFAMYGKLAAIHFVPGPAWFLWVLFLYDAVLATAAMAYAKLLRKRLKDQPDGALSRLHGSFKRLFLSFRQKPVTAALLVFLFSAVAYLPLLYHYGPTQWSQFLAHPFICQMSRIGLYFVWFTFGALIGACGLSTGLLARDGLLARHWSMWLAAAVVMFNAVWLVPTWMWKHQIFVNHLRTWPALLWLACSAICTFAATSVCIRFFQNGFRSSPAAPRSHRSTPTLARSAYGIYLTHAMYILWMEKILLDRPYPALVKAMLVFVVVLPLSWFTTQIALRIPKVREII